MICCSRLPSLPRGVYLPCQVFFETLEIHPVPGLRVLLFLAVNSAGFCFCSGVCPSSGLSSHAGESAGFGVRDDACKIVLRFLFERKIHLYALRDVFAFFRDHHLGKKTRHNQRQISATENPFPDFMLQILIKFCKHKNRTSEP